MRSWSQSAWTRAENRRRPAVFLGDCGWHTQKRRIGERRACRTEWSNHAALATNAELAQLEKGFAVLVRQFVPKPRAHEQKLKESVARLDRCECSVKRFETECTKISQGVERLYEELVKTSGMLRENAVAERNSTFGNNIRLEAAQMKEPQQQRSQAKPAGGPPPSQAKFDKMLGGSVMDIDDENDMTLRKWSQSNCDSSFRRATSAGTCQARRCLS